MHLAATFLVALLSALPQGQQVGPLKPAAKGTRPSPKAEGPYKTPLTTADMAGKQAVVETSHGSFVIDLRPDLAPNHVGYFMKVAREGAYANTLFHRVVRNGIIQ